MPSKTDDPVPEIPPAGSFRHGGRVVYIASRSRLALRYKRSKNLLNRLQDVASSITAHPIAGYVAALDKNFSTDPFATPDAVVKEKPVVDADRIEQTIEQGAKSARRAVSSGTKRVGKRLEKVFGKK